MSIQTAVILGAGKGSRLKNLFIGKPKGFLPIGETTLIERSIKFLKKSGINTIYIVTGYLSHFYESLESDNIICIKNSEYHNTGSFKSLLKVLDYINEDFLILESDLLYEERGLTELINQNRENVILASGKTNLGDEVFIEVDDDFQLLNLSKDSNFIKSIYAEFVGISKISKETLDVLFNWSNNNHENSKNCHYEEAFTEIKELKKFYVKKIDSLIWSEIDNQSQYEKMIKEILPKLKKSNNEN